MMKGLCMVYFVFHYCLNLVTKILYTFSGKNAWKEKSGVLTCSSTDQRIVHWVRPLGYTERFMTSAGDLGNMTTLYALWMTSHRSLSIQHIKYVSHLMIRKMPHLRMCLGHHNNDIWWRKMSHENLDVEEIKWDQDVMLIFEELAKHSYNTEDGPLWFVRFVTPGLQNHDMNMNTEHKYVCIFGFHHNFSDGTTNMKFCDNFMSLLNEHLLNKEQSLSEEGIFACPTHDDIANAERNNFELLKYFVKRFYRGLLSCSSSVRNFISLYPMPYDEQGRTAVLANELDELATDRLHKRCKLEGVSLNSAFTAAANIGMYKMILQREESVRRTTFYTQHAVNMRRYWPKNIQKQSYGCHISMANIKIPTTVEDIEDFWEYARKIQKNIYNELNVDKNVLRMQPLSEKLWLVLIANTLMSKLRFPSANDSHYCITNMGDISSTINDEGSVVRISKLVRSVSGHLMQALCQHTIQTFKGKLYYSLDYYTQKMSSDVARIYVSSLMDVLRSAIHKPN